MQQRLPEGCILNRPVGRPAFQRLCNGECGVTQGMPGLSKCGRQALLSNKILICKTKREKTVNPRGEERKKDYPRAKKRWECVQVAGP